MCDVLSLKNYIHIPVYVSIYVGYMTELSMSLGVGGGTIFNDHFNYKLAA